MRRLLVLLLTVVLVSIAFSGRASALPAGEDSTVSPTAARVANGSIPSNARHVRATMTLDCKDMTKTVRTYADSHGYCRAAGVMQPDNSVSGNCGSSDIYIWNNGGGYAGMYFGVSSSWGTIMLLSYGVNWHNWSYGEVGKFGDNVWPWSTYWDRSTEAYTSAGYVTALFQGVATLTWGGQCTILNPTDGTQVYW